jgi:hypothetical protein
MPLTEIRNVLDAADVTARDAAIATHLKRMESTLAHNQETVAALRLLLTRQLSPSVEYRAVPATPVVLRREVVEWDDVEDWLTSALGALHRQVEPVGPDGALYDLAFFEGHAGEVMAFMPVASSEEVLPAALYAVAVHHGPFDRLDETYGVLGSHVTARGIDAGAPIREHYFEDLVTEVLWSVTGT